MKVLFVCLGNICRSPTAEGVFRALLSREVPALDVDVDSAGTANYHPGAAPDPRSQRAAARRGIDISGLRARQIAPQDFERCDLILAMDSDNLRDLSALRPPDAPAELRLFLDYAPQLKRRDVPDPYYADAAAFDEVLDLIETASHGLLERLRQRLAQRD